MDLLDSVRTKIVSEETWLRYYIQSISYEDYNQTETLKT